MCSDVMWLNRSPCWKPYRWLQSTAGKCVSTTAHVHCFNGYFSGRPKLAGCHWFFSILGHNLAFSAWCCWLGGRKGIRPVKNLSGGVLAWLSVWNEMQTCMRPSWCHCHSLSLSSVKSRLVLSLWYWLTQVVPEKGQLKTGVRSFGHNWYEDSVDNTVEENSNIFTLVWMCWLPSSRACGQ